MNPYKILQWELDHERLQVELTPAPEPMHSGHRVRTVTASNPDWYRDLVWSRTTYRGGKRCIR